MNRQPTHYEISFPLHESSSNCPVHGCPYTAPTRVKMYRHFANRHLGDTIRIQEDEGVSQCVSCGIVGHQVLSERHMTSKDCVDRSGRQTRFRILKAQSNTVNNISFSINDVELQRVYSYKYLGRMITNTDCDNDAIERQLERARSKWKRFSAILNSRGMNSRVSGYFYKAIVQAVLLYGSETWVISRSQLKMLEVFHRRVARYLCRKHIRKLADGTWECPPTVEVLDEAGLHSIHEYISRRRETVMRFIRNRSIYAQCKRTHSLVGTKKLYWWNQEDFFVTSN